MDRREMFKLFGTAGMGLAVGGCTRADHEKPTVGAGPNHEKPVAGAGPNHEKPVAGAEGPLHSPHVHFCGIHIAKKDPKIQIIAQHYCAGHSIDEHGETMFQCVLFDTNAKNAKLLGIEYVISDKIYRTLDKVEKQYWHPHTYEVLGGGLIAPGMKDEDEKKFMNLILETWGKTWHTWPDPKTNVPIGEPLLIWSLTGDGQVDEKVLAKRDEEFKVSTADIRKRRGKEFGLEVPQIDLPKSMDSVGRQWTNHGDDKKPARKN